MDLFLEDTVEACEEEVLSEMPLSFLALGVDLLSAGDLFSFMSAFLTLGEDLAEAVPD